MRGYAHPILDADSNDTGEWCNEPEGQTEAKKQEKPFTYSPEKSASIETQVAVKAAVDLWVADKLSPTETIDCLIVQDLKLWVVAHLGGSVEKHNAVNPTTSAVNKVLQPLGMAVPEGEEPKPKAIVYATKEQKDTLAKFDKGRIAEIMTERGFPKKLSKLNAEILIDQLEKEGK